MKPFKYTVTIGCTDDDCRKIVVRNLDYGLEHFIAFEGDFLAQLDLIGDTIKNHFIGCHLSGIVEDGE